MTLKPGWTTTEWWTSLGAHIIAIVALFHTIQANNWTQAVVGLAVVVAPEIGSAIYTHNRTALKAAAVTAITTVAATNPSINSVSAAASTTVTPPPIPASATPAVSTA